MKLKTYDEWRELGYQVRKGEKAKWVSDLNGVRRVFSCDQVDELDDFDKRNGFRFEKE